MLPSASTYRVQSGDLVHAREALWRVMNVRPVAARARVVSLRGADDHNRWQQCTLLEPFDRFALRSRQEQPRTVSRRRWLRALAAIVAASPGNAQLADANVRLLAYQVEPLLAIVRGIASRVLIADGVGLGKTIQAALVLRELLTRYGARSRAPRMLVVVPAGLRDQWRRELRARVGLESRIIDAHTLAARARELPPDINPWHEPGVSIVSLDFIKQDVVLHGLRGCVWDAFIIDEAHSLTSGTERAAAAHLLARHSRLVLLLTATPHDGDDAAFDALCRIGRHDGRDERGDADDRIAIFRRTRESLGLPSARRVHILRVRPSPAERHLHALLGRYVARVEREHHHTHDGDESATPVRLAMTVLQKRASSSAWSLARSLERRLELLARTAEHAEKPEPRQPRQSHLPFDPGESESGANTQAEANAEANADDAEPLACLSTRGLASAHVERAWLMLLIRAADRAAARESKPRALRCLLRRIREPAIVYTEYRDTLTHVAATLTAADADADADPDANADAGVDADAKTRDAPRRATMAAMVVLHGGLTREAREDALRAFASGRVNVLLATDAAGEGLNLQQRCRLVINVELPWNPNRLEQRIGRVDRLGQSKNVHAFNLVSPDTAESALLETLNVRIANIAAAFRSGEESDVRTWPNLSTEATETVRTLERVRTLRTTAASHHQGAHRAAVDAKLSPRDPLIELAARAPWTSTVRVRPKGPFAKLPRGVVFIWRTRLRGDDAAELITALHLPSQCLREPWPIPPAAREAMHRKLDDLARAAIDAHDSRERPLRERAARRDVAILAALRDLQTNACGDAVYAGVGIGSGGGPSAGRAAGPGQPLLFNDLAAHARSLASWRIAPPRSLSPPLPALVEQTPTATQAERSADVDHALLLVLRLR